MTTIQVKLKCRADDCRATITTYWFDNDSPTVIPSVCVCCGAYEGFILESLKDVTDDKETESG